MDTINPLPGMHSGKSTAISTARLLYDAAYGREREYQN